MLPKRFVEMLSTVATEVVFQLVVSRAQAAHFQNSLYRGWIGSAGQRTDRPSQKARNNPANDFGRLKEHLDRSYLDCLSPGEAKYVQQTKLAVDT